MPVLSGEMVVLSDLPGEIELGDLDLSRLRSDRLLKLREEMLAREVDYLLLCGAPHARYASGCTSMISDSARASYRRTICFLSATSMHIFTPYRDGVPSDLQSECVHEAPHLHTPGGVKALVATVSELVGGDLDARIGLDQMSGAMFETLPELLSKADLVDAGPLLAACEMIKTPDEIECLYRAQRINELAAEDVLESLRPGIRQDELTALFLARINELGAAGNLIAPIWQPVPLSQADGPYTTHGEMAFPIPSTDLMFAEGDMIWVDTGIDYGGYASDYGRTWYVSHDRKVPSRQRDQFKRWCDVRDAVLDRVQAGSSGRDLTTAARAVSTERDPWLPNLYLAHSIGSFSGEPPFIGTDLGDGFDHEIELMPGMILVLEPVIWDDGHGGYRSEETVVVTRTGYEPLTTHSYAPYEWPH